LVADCALVNPFTHPGSVLQEFFQIPVLSHDGILAPCWVKTRAVLAQKVCSSPVESTNQSRQVASTSDASKTQSGLIRVALREFDRWGPYCENRRIAMELGSALSFQKLRQTPCEVHKIGWHHNHRGAVVLRSHLGDHLHTPQFQSGWIPHHQLRGVGQFLRCF